MKKQILILMFVMIIAASGCNGTTTDFNPNAGAIIEKASFDVPKVYQDEDTELSFDVVNVGGKDIAVDTITAYVYGPTIEASSSTNAEVWRIKSTPTPGDLTAASGFITYAKVNALQAADSSMKIPGGRQQFIIPLDPPNVLPGMEIPTNFYVSLCYPYQTQTITVVEVTSKNELRATGQQSTRKDSINAAGPIHVTVSGDGTLRSAGTGSFSLPLLFKIQDVGGGYPTLSTLACAADQTTTNRDKVSITVEVDGATTAVCSGSATNNNIADVKLKDGVGTVYCKYTAGASTTPRRIYNVKTTVAYKYTVTSVASVVDVGTSGTA